ncbi:MAG TPA: hypothetical protein DCL44_03000 [Elusimicrobia bacterium]|nr:hypothetical protein [Elusimicrobiota bacterium]
MKNKSILVTGCPGNLGTRIVEANKDLNILAPTIHELDIRNAENVRRFFESHGVDAVIHCAAIAKMALCEEDPVNAIDTNIIGTCNLVKCVLRKEAESRRSIRFIHISTDGVYHSEAGNYSEKDSTIPYNKYGWTKLGAEACVNLLSNFCVIRTRFFIPEGISYNESAADLFTSKIPVNELVEAIKLLLWSDFRGTINIGGPRKSDYEIHRVYKPDIRPCKRLDMVKDLPVQLAGDASMDVTLWLRLKKQLESGANGK